MYLAVKYGDEKIVSLLLEEGADPNQETKSKRTPLHVARTPKIVQLLLNFNADFNENAWTNQLESNEKLAEVVMDDFIDTNEEKSIIEYESNDKLIVHYFSCWKSENS